MILVVGSTGFLGSEICRRLSDRGQSVRALVRATSDAQRVERLRALGVETVVGDLKDRASLDAACAGVSAVISTAPRIASQRAGPASHTDSRRCSGHYSRKGWSRRPIARPPAQKLE